MATQDAQQARVDGVAAMTGGTVTLQCVASVAGTLIGESLGSTLAAKLVAGVLGALVGAFLTAPGRHRRRRLVAVAGFLALVDALRRAVGAAASQRKVEPHAWVPANWAVVGLTAVVGLAGGSAVTTARGGWEPDPARVAVPDVRGEPRDAAIAILDDAGVRASATTEPSESIAEGSATRTDPPAGASVAEDAEVALYVSSGPPGATVQVPDVTGSPRRAALAVLEDVGIRPRPRTEPSDSVARGRATRTDPPAGTRVDRGAAVTLLVSSGPAAELVRIPDVRGRPRTNALALLRDAGLRPQTEREPSADVAEGSATRSEPPAGSELPRGAAVMLFVSSGPVPVQVRVPDVAGISENEAVAVLEDAGLLPEVVSESSESDAEGTVIRTDPVADTPVEQGSAVTVVVSSGPDDSSGGVD